MPHEFFATCPKGTSDLLAAELTSCGATELRERAGGVSFRGELEVAYRACLWSRLANRVLLVLARFPAPDEAALYAGVGSVDWSLHLNATDTFAIDAITSHSQLTHTQFIAQRAKDALVDQFRARFGARPSVDTSNPALSVSLYLDRDQAQLALDLAGRSLHRRGYRTDQGPAPLKENLAAAILLRAGWSKLAANDAPLIDPMCGSGTFLIEAALIAADIAPGLFRSGIGCEHWRGHAGELWARLVVEAEARRTAGLARLPVITGYDSDRAAVQRAVQNIAQAGLHGHVHVERRELAAATPLTAHGATGLVVCNPPYGERLGERATLAPLYHALGHQLREAFAEWDAAIFTGAPALGLELGIKAYRTHSLFNGALECKLLRFKIKTEFFNPVMPPGSARVIRAQQRVARAATISPGGEMFANRLRKNLRVLGKWARREAVSCYRLYDADMPEYALAIDLYTSHQRWLHVQEYAAPDTVDENSARTRLDEALAQLPALLEIEPQHIVFKRRQPQRGAAQYERHAETASFIEVEEAGLKFRVNLRDYLDTGLFLDHRLTRARVRTLAADRDVLNLFAYTGSASVYAAAGGARSTTAVDLSATYCIWARQNLTLNAFHAPYHRVLQADCLEWLADEPDRRYGLIFLDPPTFSNSKRMRAELDIQRDYIEMIAQCRRWLTDDGVLLFSTNLRRFKFDLAALPKFTVKDLSRETLPEDFARNPRIHQCYELRVIP